MIIVTGAAGFIGSNIVKEFNRRGRTDILVVDEVLAVGDAEFQQKCFKKFRDLHAEGRTVIMVTHSMEAVKAMCDQAAWIDKGTLQQVGDATAVVEAYHDSLHLDSE